MTDSTLAQVPARTSSETGPFGLMNQDSASDWKPYIHHGRTPTSAEAAFAHKCTRLRDRIERFQRSFGLAEDERALETQCAIRESFQAGLVQHGGSASLDALNRQLGDIERDFVIEHAVLRYRRRVRTTLLLGVIITALMLAIAAGATLYWNSLMKWLVSDQTLLGTLTDGTARNNFTAYAFVILGVLLGRIIALFMDYGRQIESFDAYDDAYRVIASPFLDASIDVLIGFVACLCFVTGAIVISVGQGAEGGTPELSTLKIKDRWEIAMVFGVLIGLVRARFLSRLSSAAGTSVG